VMERTPLALSSREIRACFMAVMRLVLSRSMKGRKQGRSGAKKVNAYIATGQTNENQYSGAGLTRSYVFLHATRHLSSDHPMP